METIAPSQQERHQFTCLSCHIAFHSSQNQREHYHSDWHRFNLKRKVIELPPISLDVFTQKLHSIEKTTPPKTLISSDYSCEICHKSYSSNNAYANHLQSKKHKEMELKSKLIKDDETDQDIQEIEQVEKEMKNNNELKESKSTDMEDEGFLIIDPPTLNVNISDLLKNATSEEEIDRIVQMKLKIDKLSETDCLFCKHQSNTFEMNMEHMIKSHSFFIPDIEYLVDLKGMIEYLADKVSVAHVCLYCNGKGKAWHNLDAVRQHMIGKGHCKILYEDDADLEFAEFYDFSPIEQNQETDWEDTNDEYCEELVEAHDEQSIVGRPNLSQDLVSDNVELILANGKKAGHRSHSRIWKQSLRPVESRDSILINRLAGQYRMLGWGSKEHQDIQLRKKQAMEFSRKNLSERTKVGIKANGLMKYFRIQNPI